jgi:hypothetical protein
MEGNIRQVKDLLEKEHQKEVGGEDYEIFEDTPGLEVKIMHLKNFIYKNYVTYSVTLIDPMGVITTLDKKEANIECPELYEPDFRNKLIDFKERAYYIPINLN